MRSTHWGFPHQGAGNQGYEAEKWGLESREVLGVSVSERKLCAHVCVILYIVCAGVKQSIVCDTCAYIYGHFQCWSRTLIPI